MMWKKGNINYTLSIRIINHHNGLSLRDKTGFATVIKAGIGAVIKIKLVQTSFIYTI